MTRQLPEELILLIHVLKWLILAAGIGLLVGMTSTGFVLFLIFLSTHVKLPPGPIDCCH